MNTVYVFNLNFMTDAGTIHTLRLTGADPGATEADVKDTMQDVIASGAIVTKNGSPVSSQSAVLVTTETEQISVK